MAKDTVPHWHFTCARRCIQIRGHKLIPKAKSLASLRSGKPLAFGSLSASDNAPTPAPTDRGKRKWVHTTKSWSWPTQKEQDNNQGAVEGGDMSAQAGGTT